MLNGKKSNGNTIGYSIQDLFERTSISKSFWRKEIRSGRLKATYFGTRVIVLAGDFEAYLGQKQGTKS